MTRTFDDEGELFSNAQRALLVANGRERGRDHFPVVKLVHPDGTGVWLVSEMDAPHGDRLFGLADLGSPELGFFRLSELLQAGVEPDRSFVARHPISVYARAARETGAIVDWGPALAVAARPRS